MISNWREKTLEEIILFKNGKKRPSEDGNIPVYGGNGVLSYTDKTNYSNCVIVGRVGAYCGSVYYEPNNCWISDNAIAGIAKEGTDVKYAYYLLSSLNLNKRHIGTGQPLLTQGILNGIEANIPDYESQCKISNILGTIDEKIKLNNEINKNLSEQIETLYMEHFLEDCNGVLSDICNYTKERIDVELLTDETYYSTENMLPNKAGATVASGLPTTGKTPACFPGNVLISNIRPYFKKIVYCHEESGCSADVLCFVAKNSLLVPYIFATLYVDKFFDYMVAGSKGTKMPRGDKQQIMRYPVHIPTEEELKVFSLTASNILEMIHLNTLENKRLEAIRDSLLPKLMSGEVDVSQVVL